MRVIKINIINWIELRKSAIITLLHFLIERINKKLISCIWLLYFQILFKRVDDILKKHS